MTNPAVRPTPQTPPTPQPHAESRPEAQAGGEEAKPTIRTWVTRAIIAVLVTIGIVWGIKTFIYSQSHETTDDAELAGHVIPVIFKVPGYIERVYVNDNQHVKVGDTLVVLDPRDYTVALEQAQANLRAATAAGRTGSAAQTIKAAEAQHAAYTADIAVAQANYDRAERDVARFRDLAAKNIVSDQQLDQAVATDKAAAAQLAAAQAQAASSGATVAGAGYEEANADFRVTGLQAALETARLQLDYTVLTAPVNGFISKKTAEIGQYVQAGQEIMAIVQNDTSWVIANMKETQLRDIKIGQPAEVSVDAFRGKPLQGKVNSIQDATGATFALLPPDNATGNFTKIVQRVPVKIVLDSTQWNGRPLSPGLSVEVSIDTKSH
jgi:membrane fusion protein, multidrug efflux system